jgi:predicted MFS family arabinose efflux permease
VKSSGPSRTAKIAIAIAAGLALADASIVVLALPPILTELDASVEGVAAVIGAYTLGLGLALMAAGGWTRGLGAARMAWTAMLAFAAASTACGLAQSMALLIALRGIQGIAAAAVLVAAFELLGAGQEGGRGRSLWTAAAVFGTAAGPALGGTLTELLDWRAIFLTQGPIVAIAALVCGVTVRDRTSMSSQEPGRQPRVSVAALALGLLAAALTGVLFLLVLLLISGWALSPLEAAAVVSALPLAAFLGTRVRGEPAPRAIAGCALVGTGVLCLAFLPVDTVAMTVVPQLAAGVGMGMALPALAGGLLPERTTADAARLLSVRHLGITLALAILAPIAAAQLDTATERVRERGTALILDAELPPGDKLDLADVATADLDAIAPRAALRDSLGDARRDVADDDLGAYDRLRDRADETLVMAINDAFAPAFLICGALALLAALGLLLSTRARPARTALAACALAAVLLAGQAGVAAATRPDEVVIADPCKDRQLPQTGGLDGRLQEGALAVLDRAACRFGSSREELALALVDGDEARAYEREHGVDPRSPGDLLGELLDGLLGR